MGNKLLEVDELLVGQMLITESFHGQYVNFCNSSQDAFGTASKGGFKVILWPTSLLVFVVYRKELSAN